MVQIGEDFVRADASEARGTTLFPLCAHLLKLHKINFLRFL